MDRDSPFPIVVINAESALRPTASLDGIHKSLSCSRGEPRSTNILEGRVCDRRHPRGRFGRQEPIGLTEFGPPKSAFSREPFMPTGGTPEDENVEPRGSEASSRWLSLPTADDTTGGENPKSAHPGRGASLRPRTGSMSVFTFSPGGIAATVILAQPPANGWHPCGMTDDINGTSCRG